jgi:tetratricopeptide (TPR) repeat protein
MRQSPFVLTVIALTGAVTAAWLSHRSSLEKPPAAISSVPESLSPALGKLLSIYSQPSGASSLDRELRLAVETLRRHPQSSDKWVRFGDALLQRSRNTLDFSLYPQIEQAYLEARRLDPENIQALAGLAWAAGACHRFDDSVAWARLALAKDPDLPAAHGIIGDAAVELGRYAEAEKHYQRMLDLRPDMGSYSRAAHLLYLQGNSSRALALMRQALRAGGENPEHTAWCVAELASMLCREGAAPAARQLIESYLPRSPENPVLLAAAGQAHAALGDQVNAIARYEHSVRLVHQHHTLAALYDLYLASNRAEEAERIFERIETLHRDLRAQKIQGGEGQLARFYADVGKNLPEAVRLAELEHSHHETATAADALAWAYFRAGRNQEAGKLLPVILRHRAIDPAMLYHVGLIEESLGRRADAQRHLYAALSRESRFNPVHAPLAEAALQRLGSTTTAAGLAK